MTPAAQSAVGDAGALDSAFDSVVAAEPSDAHEMPLSPQPLVQKAVREPSIHQLRLFLVLAQEFRACSPSPAARR